MLPPALAAAAILGFTTLVVVRMGGDAPRSVESAVVAPTLKPQRVAVAPIPLDPLMLDPRPALGAGGPGVWANAPVPADWHAASAQPLASAEASSRPGQAEQAGTRPPQVGQMAQASPFVPLPVPRPPELRGPVPGPAQLAGRRSRVAAAVPQQDNRSFFEKLFGVEPSAGPAVSYAALGTGSIDAAPQARLTPSPDPVAPGGGTAVYDIAARTVTLPGGERLEAHSGLGDKLDDARYVHVRMHGPTPPATYDLTEREQLFHGVRALRLTPVSGSGAIYGRAGLLAHTFMLGPNGDSNGCVSFRDYERFLQAYLRGEVRRLVVVAGRGQDRSQVVAQRQIRTPARPAPGDRDV